MQILNQLVLDENNIAYHQMMGNSYQLNTISHDIVMLLKEEKTKDEIIETLFSRYEVSTQQLFIDVSDFMSKLKVYGLV